MNWAWITVAFKIKIMHRKTRWCRLAFAVKYSISSLRSLSITIRKTTFNSINVKMHINVFKESYEHKSFVISLVKRRRSFNGYFEWPPSVFRWILYRRFFLQNKDFELYLCAVFSQIEEEYWRSVFLNNFIGMNCEAVLETHEKILDIL